MTEQPFRKGIDGAGSWLRLPIPELPTETQGPAGMDSIGAQGLAFPDGLAGLYRAAGFGDLNA